MSSDLPALIEELKRRRVFRAVLAYGVVAFTALQIIEPIMHAYHWPDAVLTYAVTALAVGFLLVVGLAWIFDLNAGRIERTASAATLRGVRLWGVLALVATLGAAPGLIWYFVVRARPAPSIDVAPPAKPGVAPAGNISAAPSIAVLPLVNLSSDKEQEYFSDGLSEELLNLLAKVPGLKVTGRTSSFAFKGKDDDLRTIAQKLGVAHILEGSVRRSGEQLRITTQLISATDGYELWSETYDRKLTDVFAVQDEIANAVVGALKLKLLPGTEKGRGTANIEAYNQVLIARQFRTRGTLEDYRHAQQAYLQATQLDANYSAAWAGLARTTFVLADIEGAPRAEATPLLEQARAEAEKAVALGPDVTAFATRAFIRATLEWNWAGAGADIQQALALEPENIEALTGYAVFYLRPLGRSSESLTVLRRATELDPLSGYAWATLGAALSESGDQAAAQTALARALEISPSSYVALYCLCMSELLSGRADDALAVARRTTGQLRAMAEALVQHSLGHPAESTRALEEMIAQHADTGAIQIAEVYGWRGETDKAFAWLERARAQRDTGMGTLKPSVFLRSLHGDPRWKPLLASVNLPLD